QHRTPHPRRTRRKPSRPDDDRDHAPSVGDRGCRPDPGTRARQDPRTRHPCRTTATRSPLRDRMAAPNGGARAGSRQRLDRASGAAMRDPYDDDKLEARFQLGFIKDLWPFVRPYKRGFLACLLILFASFGLELLGPWLMRLAIDGPMRATHVEQGSRLSMLWWYGAGFVGVTLGGALLGYVYGLVTAWNGQRVIRDVRRSLY